MNKFISIGIPGIIVAAACFALGLWLIGGRGATPLPPRLPGQDNRPAVVPAPPPPAPPTPPAVTPAPAPAPAPAPTPTVGGAWPHFRGARYDNINTESTPLARTWGTTGPRILWSVDLGEGHAGPAVLNGRVYLLDYDKARQQDVVRCLSLADGHELWRYGYAASLKSNHGISRTIPAVTGQYCVTLGPLLHLVCTDATTGALQWSKNLVTEFGASVLQWYNGQCPVIDGNKVIIATGGRALLVAFDLASGRVLWQTPNPDGWQMTHSSVLPYTFGGTAMYISTYSGGVAGMAADTGAVLWKHHWRVNVSNIPMPVPVGDGKLFLTGGYGAGSALIRLPAAAGATAQELFRIRESVFGSHQQTPIFYKGHLYGASLPDGQFVCLDLQGRRVWSSGGSHRFGLGPYLLAGDLLYLLGDNGVLTLVQLSEAGYRPLAQARILSGPDAWAPMALVGGRLLARDLNRMVCLDVSQH